MFGNEVSKPFVAFCCSYLTKHSLAYAELYITLSTIVTRFDWEMYETTLDDIVCKHDFFVAVGDLNSKGVRARFKIRKS